jgi:LmbE family N-acetylglucosaminyl deacetylase
MNERPSPPGKSGCHAGYFCGVALLLGIGGTAAYAQELSMDAGTLAHALDRLANTGRVLYVAAHPDDENTRLLAYLANNRHVTAAYLSVTRGSGGQNLIGAEQDELLGVIRTEELMAARRLDAAEQRFTNMRDFGYSKSAEETLRIWGHDEALADVVRIIRSFQPDVIITRFEENPPNHGHHTASAILAREAFSAAADPKRFPEQLQQGVGVWQADRLLFNVPMWRRQETPKGAIAVDVGVYDARLGLGYGELAARSRSQHKSQGFGRAGERGPLLEYFLPLAGTKPEKDILEGLSLGWARFGQLAVPLDAAFDKARAALGRDAPEQAIPALLAVHATLAGLPGAPRVIEARRRLDELIAACAALFIRATAPQPAAVPGATVPITVEIAARRPASVTLRTVTIEGATPTTIDAAIEVGARREIGQQVAIATNASISAPYWLASPPLPGRYAVAEAKLIGRALGPPPLSASVELSFGGRTVRLEVPVVYVWTDRVHGERIRPFLVVPPATVTPARAATLFPNGRPSSVGLRVRAWADAFDGEVRLPLPKDWQAEPKSAKVQFVRAGEERTVSFRVTPAKGAGAIELRPEIEVAGRKWSYREDVIDYPHIPLQTVLQPAALALVPLDLETVQGTVGYIPGSGDTVAEDLASVGVNVVLVDDETLRTGELDRYKAIVVGIRAYNTRPVLRAAHQRLMAYVERGGTVVVQYNTTSEWEVLDTPIGPYPLTLGRGRVTDENAEMVAVDSAADVLTRPNRIGPKDFEGWVQERGLYFAETFDERYRPVFRISDPGEDELSGGLLIAPYGKGRYVYTGLAFFRQLPAGVPGAYRLFVNLLAAEAP